MVSKSFAVSLLGAFALFANVASAQVPDRDLIFLGDSSYVKLNPSSQGSSIPQRGSSLLDKLFSKPDQNGQRVYDIPYPYDRFLDRLAGRPTATPRFLTRIRSLKTVDELIRFLVTDLFIRAPEEIADQESLFTFGRSLQKPRKGNAIINPWTSPREVSMMNLPREPHLSEVGRVQNRLFCGHVENLHSMECISWNSEAGRFEFQVVENYGDQNLQKVVYVNRSKCLACHQGGAPIFPKLDWLESDDNLGLELGTIFSNYGGNRADLYTRKAEVELAMNARINTSRQERQRTFTPATERFRVIKAGKFDRAVRDASALIEVNKLWIHLCGDSEQGNACRRLAMKAYLFWVAHAPLDNNDVTRRDQDNETLNYISASKNYLAAGHKDNSFGLWSAIIPSDVPKMKTIEYNWDTIKSAKIFGPFIFDRDPLTAVFETEDIVQCADGKCKWDFVETLISQASSAAMVKQGQDVNSFFNPRVLRDLPLSKAKSSEEAMLELAKELRLFFYNGRTSFDQGNTISRDLKDWLSAPQDVRPRPSGNSSVRDFELGKFFAKIDKMDDRFFGPIPFSRERMLFGLWEGVDDRKAAEFFRIATMRGPTKEMEKIAKPFEVEVSKEPTLALVTQVCAECHGTGRGQSNVPQFAFAESRSELISNVYYHRTEMIKQLKAENMPPVEAMGSLSNQQRADLIDYLSKMSASGAEAN
jgi:mono/diheme cytochrome c family protein